MAAVRKKSKGCVIFEINVNIGNEQFLADRQKKIREPKALIISAWVKIFSL